MVQAPIVTGLSPKEGPPGTKVTIRGENFGNGPNDLINVTICGFDCTLSAEWKSPNKIIVATGPGKGKGEIIVATRSGGVGTCLVQFRGYHDAPGPTKESAVWVEDTAINSLAWGRKSLSPSGFQQDDPLGLSVEGNDKKMPEDDLRELFPDGSGDLTSDQFVAGWFLLEHHQATSFEDLRAGLSFLRRKVESQKEGQLSFLKSNASSVMEQLDMLVKLKEKFEKDEVEQIKQVEKVEEKIKIAMYESKKLFDEVLARRERADATRNALAVLLRYKFLFCLPPSIERNIQKNEFDLIINDYARVKNLFKNMPRDIPIFQRVMQEIEERIIRVKEILFKKLDDIPLSLDEYIKVIRNLLNLDVPDPAWTGIESYSKHLASALNDIKEKNIVAETANKKDKTKNENKLLQGDVPPQRVIFVEEIIDLMENKFPNLWRLGQCYFGGELGVTVPTKREQYKIKVLEIIDLFSNLVRAALLPHSLSRKTQQRQMYGIWSNVGAELLPPWLSHCLRYLRSCYSTFIRLDLPSDALDIISRLIFDLRIFCVLTLFKQTADSVNTLEKNETWLVELNETYGGITSLPTEFENKVKEVLSTVHDSVLIDELREIPLFENPTARRDIEQQLAYIFSRFTNVLEKLGLLNDDDISVHDSLIFLANASISKTMSWEQRMLVTICNCHYTSFIVIPRITELIGNQGYPSMDTAFSAAVESLSNLRQRLLDTYLEQKCDPLVGTIEPSMYTSRFEWDTISKPTSIRPYAKEIIMNMISVRSELFRVPVNLINTVMCKITSTVFEELARLMCTVRKFSLAGSVQARADIYAVKEATKAFSSSTSNRFCKEALEHIPALDKEADMLVEEILKKFRSNMKLQISCLHGAEMRC